MFFFYFILFYFILSAVHDLKTNHQPVQMIAQKGLDSVVLDLNGYYIMALKYLKLCVLSPVVFPQTINNSIFRTRSAIT